MSQPVPLESARVAILGLGLMGGSLALALKGYCREILGIDNDAGVIEAVLENGIMARASTAPESLLPEADIVILAAPVGTILELIDRLPELHPGDPVIMDIGSTKVRICQALDRLPARFDPIGGHPMCGKETSGIENADPGLFRDAVFALTPLARTRTRAKTAAEQIVEVAGAQPLWLEPELHDRWTAATSHMPYLLSVALSLATPGEAAQMIGPGFRSTSRLAGSSTSMMMDILLSNREFVLDALRGYRQQLDKIEALFKNREDSALRELLRQGRDARENLLWNPREEAAG